MKHGSSNPTLAPDHSDSITLADNTLFQVVNARHGVFLVNRNDVYIGGSLINYGEYSEVEFRLLEQVTPSGGVVIEVGSHLGAHTIPLCKKVGAAGKLLAFEPQPIMFQYLCANLSLNGLTNCYAYNRAVGKESSTLKIPDIDYSATRNYGNVKMEWFANNQDGQEILITPLDSLNLNTVNVIKIDAEGMELEILKGAVKTIRKHSPSIACEIDFTEKGKAVIAFLLDHNYDIWPHAIPLFNPQNFFKNPENIFGNTTSSNLLCVSKDLDVKINLPKINSMQDWEDMLIEAKSLS